MGWGGALKSILGKVAPTIGTALGGPVGGMATKFLADKLLGKPEATEKEVEAFLLGATPEQMLKLKTLDLEFEKSMKQLDIDVFKLEVEDRKSARDLFKVNIWPQISLTIVFIVGYFVIFRLVGLGSIVIKEEFMKGVFVTMLGALMTSIPQILAFWFGSSSGSQQKTKELAMSRPAMPGETK